MGDPIVGFIGVGTMGGPMVRQLAAAGYRVLVFDADPAVLGRMDSVSNVTRTQSIAAVAGTVDMLFTCLPNDNVVGAVYLSDCGIESSARGGLITVDCSTVSPDITQRVHAALQHKGIQHLDASMLGSVAQAKAGTIGFIVGGEVDAYARVAPLLGVMGKMVRHVGPSGAANGMKLIHQTLVAAHAVAVSEALALCLMTDTDIETFYDIVCQGGGLAHSRYFENRVPRIRSGEFAPLFTLEFMLKDAQLAAGLVERSREKLPVLAKVVETLGEAVGSGWGDEDFSAVVHVLERRAGISVTANETD